MPSIIRCPECRNKSSSSRASCPYCGEIFDEGIKELGRTGNEWTLKHWLVLPFFVFGLGGIFLWVFNPVSDLDSSRNGDREARQIQQRAYTLCQRQVRDRLRAPSTASFPFSNNAAISTIDRNSSRFIVRSHVDAENAFGATIRTKWVCEIEQVGDQWRLHRINLND